METQEKFLSPGVKAMFLSTIAFTVANVLVKQIPHIPAMEIVFFRCSVAASLCFIGLYRDKADWKGSNHTLLILRGTFGTIALYCFFLTVQNIPLASAMTLQYLSPIFTTIIAIFLLSEKVKGMQWLFYAMAFAGVLMIEQFDTRISYFYLALGISSAFCSGVAYNLVRRLREREHPLTVVLHFQLVGILAGGVSLFFNWKTPVGWDWAYLLLTGVVSQIGQIYLTSALQKERAASVAIINYSGLVYGLSIGYIVFGESQSFEALAGMALVVLGVIFSVFYGKRQRDIEKIEATAG